MESLFSENRRDEQVKEILGFVDADFGFDHMKREIRVASRTLFKYIGEDTWNAIHALIDEAAAEPDEILQTAHAVILFDAYRQYAPNMDLSHTPDGRKMRANEHVKVPMEYMLDRSNENLERKYFENLDRLLDLMETTTDFDAWKASEEYAKMTSTWVSSTEVLQSFYPDGNRTILIKLLPELKRVQRNGIKSRLTGDMYEAISLLIKNRTESDDTTLERIKDLSREIMIYKALAWAFPRSQLTMFPEGVLQSFTGDRTTTRGKAIPLDKKVDEVANIFHRDAAARAQELDDLLQSLKPVEQQSYSKSHIIDANDNFISL